MKTKSKVKFQNKSRANNAPKKLNPFEVHINRSKHQVLGRKLKSDHGLPGISRNKALQKRKNTLLQEYKMKDKLSQFIDQRIGRNDKSMTEDDRIMARFAAERMRMFKRNKKAKFNLSDADGPQETLFLTHRNQTLSEIEKFDDIGSDDEDDDDRGKSGALKGKFVGNAHFGGGLLTQGKQDRGSLIDELINESKKRKAERQRNKEETLEATEQLDEDWKTLGMMVTSKPEPVPEEVSSAQKKDEYDLVMRRLKFEPQAQASQRLKTDDEIAKEDKEQLEKLEKERLKQLREVEANKYGNHRSADDLDDGFSYDVEGVSVDNVVSQTEEAESSDSSSESDVEMASGDEDGEEGEDVDQEDSSEEEEKSQPQLKKKEKKASTKHGESENDIEEEEEEEEGEKANDMKTYDDEGNESAAEIDDEPSDDDECAMDDLTDLMPSVTEEKNSDRQLIAKVLAKAKCDKSGEETKHQEETETIKPIIELDLPYVLDVPETYESFKELLDRHSVEQQNVIFERLVKSNHPSLEPGNKKKLLRLAEYVIDLVNEGEIPWKALSILALHFGGLKEFNREECLKMLVDRISVRLEDLTRNSLPVPTVKCLVWYILLLLKPQGMEVLLPVSRPVLSLACLLISHADPAAATAVPLLCCCLLLQDAKSSSLVYTEAVTFLHKCVQASTSTNVSNPIDEKKCQKSTNSSKSSSRSPQDTIVEELRLRLTEEGEEEDPTARDSRVLYCSTVLLAGFVKVYRKYPQSKILFKPVHQSYKQIQAESHPPTVRQEVEGLQTLLEVLQSARLPPVVKTAKKPKALRQYEPSFHTVTVVGRSHRGLPADKQEEQKLLHKYKHEMKGALRELRRDRSFLAGVKLREKAQSDEQRKRKVREILGSAAAQQGELRSLKRKK